MSVVVGVMSQRPASQADRLESLSRSCSCSCARWDYRLVVARRRTAGEHIPTQMTLNWKPRLSSFFSIWVVMLSKPTWLLGKTLCGSCPFIVAAAIVAGWWWWWWCEGVDYRRRRWWRWERLWWWWWWRAASDSKMTRGERG